MPENVPRRRPDERHPRDAFSDVRVQYEAERAVISLEGEHDVATLHAISDALLWTIGEGAGDVVVDMSGVTFVGSATLSALVHGRDVLAARSRALVVRRPAPCVSRLLRFYQLIDLVEASASQRGAAD